MDKGRKGPVPDTRERPQRRGFRGTAENSKTKICMRYEKILISTYFNLVHAKDRLASCLVIESFFDWHYTDISDLHAVALILQVAERRMSFWRPMQLCTRR